MTDIEEMKQKIIDSQETYDVKLAKAIDTIESLVHERNALLRELKEQKSLYSMAKEVIESAKLLRDFQRESCDALTKKIKTMEKALRIINADAHAFNIDWIRQHSETGAKVVENIRKWSAKGLAGEE